MHYKPMTRNKKELKGDSLSRLKRYAAHISNQLTKSNVKNSTITKGAN